LKYLLDTNVCVAYLRRPNSPVRHELAKLVPSDIALCSVVLAGLYYGALRSAQPARNQAEVAVFAAIFRSLPLDDAAAIMSARLRANLAAAGRIISAHDILIAAIALANDVTLVTRNTREFSRISGLRLEDWEAMP